MITEDYVSFEIAKLLKEKGFLKGVDLRMTQNLSFYDSIGLSHNLNKYYDSLIQDKIDFVVAPTHQMAMKWLREVHNFFIQIVVDFSDGAYPMYDVCIVDLARGTSTIVNGYDRYSYKQACETAIKYCLKNLI